MIQASLKLNDPLTKQRIKDSVESGPPPPPPKTRAAEPRSRSPTAAEVAAELTAPAEAAKVGAATVEAASVQPAKEPALRNEQKIPSKENGLEGE